MKLLIVGGGVFLGAATLRSAVAHGHQVTVFNRGRARQDWPAGVEVLVGDRDSDADLPALATRSWDAVLDTCGYLPRQLRASCAALQGCGRYLFVSSVSVYASFARRSIGEDEPLADAAAIDPEDRSAAAYGAQKAACEAVVREAFGPRALLVRPGLIIGPGDPTGRFSYWPWRVAAGGEMLVPDLPVASAALQLIDVHDLAGWLVALLEAGAAGAFNAVGPVDGPGITWASLLADCRTAAAQRGHAPARTVALDEGFLLDQGVQPWSELPLWVPSTDPADAGFNHLDPRRARQAGLRTRPLAETIAAILDEGLPAPDDPRRRGKLAPLKESALIDAWRAANTAPG